MDAALCARRLTADQWCMLANLSGDVGITMSELAARTQLPPSSATRHADHLAERGYIFRVAAADDRRRILIGLSRRGEELVAEVRAEEARAEAQMRRSLGSDDYLELVRLLGRIAETPVPK
ncbi:MarR family winged helix-turn-helix transcriptional regulator [Nocardia yunnanensis]|uniref:MarR family winged helix-turn-helix transcriptional regulator n=1 Tax=Nocardia yunnanensis TaxID=2382165 RepID=UPI001FE3228C|nr:MarR family transcriptional regulator [Nocardia yunnanensis]